MQNDYLIYEALAVYLEGVADAKINIDHFAPVDRSELALCYSDIRSNKNPYPCPISLDRPFGRFNVALTDNYSSHIARFNIAKAREYDNIYVMATHQYDILM